MDRNGGLEGVRQRANYQGKQYDEFIRAEKVLVYTHRFEENPWYGRSALATAYYHYDKKHRLYWLAHLAAQFKAVPGLSGSMSSAGHT